MGKLWELLKSHIDSSPYPPSERQLAARLGVAPTTLANWRDPKNLPTRANLQAIANLVGVRYSVVLDAALYDTGYHEGARVIPLRHRPITTIEAELQLAAQDLDDFEQLNVTGKSAQSKRHELQASVDALQAELDASRSATTGADSVAEL